MKQKITNITVREFLSAFFADENETINLRAIAGKGISGIEAKKYSITRKQLSTDDGLKKDLFSANEDCGVYFVVNSGGQTDAEINRYNAFFVENDDLSIEEQHQALDSAPIQPSIRVETKRSVHAYWLIDGKCSEAEWRDVQARLINYFDGDKNIKNPSRCMRVPFFDHVALIDERYEYQRVEVVTFEPSQKFTVEEMKSAFPTPEISIEVEKSDDRDDVTSDYEKEIFSSWEELNAELAARIVQQGKRNAQGKYVMRCPVHLGKTETSLFYNPATKAILCSSGKCSHAQILEAFGLPTKPQAINGKDEKATQSELLLKLASDAELFTSQNDEPYTSIVVNDHTETWLIESKAFKTWLGKKFYEKYKKVASKNALDDALSTLIGKAAFDGEKKQVFTRRAEIDGEIYLDLVNDDWQVAKITADGWEIVSECPVKFRRTRGMKPLPLPVRGGSLNELDKFLNIHGDDLILVKAWLMCIVKFLSER